MTGCRVSEEDRGDPHFDGNEPEAEAMCDSNREDFVEMLDEVKQMATVLLRNDKWLPDFDDLDAVKHLLQHLKYYEAVRKI
tara:strand:+ start:420 stop:662 length:243 start_codon:yes stop_codon:yes gene_type:complete